MLPLETSQSIQRILEFFGGSSELSNVISKTIHVP
jgi:hypothetical protein